MSRICTICGTVTNDTVNFCPQCGGATSAPVGQNPPPYTPPYAGQPYAGQPPYYVVVRQPRPGRGFGITSMIMGIIGVVYSFLFFIMGLAFASATRYAEPAAAFAIMSLIYSVFGFLALIFGGVARNRGYRCGISLSGVVLGGISLGFCFLSVLVALAA